MLLVIISSFLFSIRCLPGYPYKCPKLQITPEKGLSENDADKLLSLLHDQVIVHSLIVILQNIGMESNDWLVCFLPNTVFSKPYFVGEKPENIEKKDKGEGRMWVGKKPCISL